MTKRRVQEGPIGSHCSHFGPFSVTSAMPLYFSHINQFYTFSPIQLDSSFKPLKMYVISTVLNISTVSNLSTASKLCKASILSTFSNLDTISNIYNFSPRRNVISF